MTIRLHKSLEVAENITKRVMDDMRVLVTANDIIVTTYHNGREIGHALTYYTLGELGKMEAICYSENRNTDKIVVYFSDYNSLPSISDEAYENRKFFSSRSYDEVAEYIIEKILADDKIYLQKREEYELNEKAAK